MTKSTEKEQQYAMELLKRLFRINGALMGQAFPLAERLDNLNPALRDDQNGLRHDVEDEVYNRLAALERKIAERYFDDPQAAFREAMGIG